MQFRLVDGASELNEEDYAHVDATIGSGSSVPIYWEGGAETTLYYPTPGLSQDYEALVNVPFDASSLQTGVYDWSVEFDNEGGNYAPNETSTGYFVHVVNRTGSAFGDGWSLPGLDQLFIQPGSASQPAGVSLLTSSDALIWFGDPNDDDTHTEYTREANPYNFSTIEKLDADGSYTLTDPDGTIHNFNSDGYLTSVVDRNENTLGTYTYDGSNRISLVTDEAGRTTKYEYNGDDLIWKITDFCKPADWETPGQATSSSQVTTYEYTLTGDHVDQMRMTGPDPDGDSGPLSSSVTTYNYNETGKLVSVIDARGLETDVSYDGVGLVNEIQQRCGGSIIVTTAESQATGSLTDTGDLPLLVPFREPGNLGDAVNDSPGTAGYELQNIYGNTSLVVRGSFGNILAQEDTQLNVTQYSYDDSGLPSHVIEHDPDGTGPSDTLTTIYVYNDDTGQITEILHPIGDEQWAYETVGATSFLDQYTDRNGNITLYEPDGAGNVASMTQVIGTDDQLEDPMDVGSDLTTIYTYTDGSGETGTGSFGTTELAGLVETVTDPNGNVTLYTYYENGLVKDVVSAYNTADEVTEHYDYDDRDRLQTFTDGRGNETTYVYDNLDRLIQRIDPDPDGEGDLTSPVWYYSYDANDNQTHVIDPLGVDTEYVYDVRDRVMSEIQRENYPQNPIAYWRLDESSGTTAVDSSDSGMTGTVTGTPSWEPGTLGNGFQFDGSQKISNPTLLDTPASVTISAWANLDTPDGSGAEVVSLGDHFAIRLDSSGESGAFVYTGGSTWVFASINQTFAGTGWHFYAATFNDDTNTLKFYVDGNEVASASASAITYSGDGSSTIIGANGGGDNYFDFDGTIDDVRVYDYALSAAEVAELNSSSEAPVLHWRLDEASGTKAVDSSDSHVTGTVVGNEDWGPGVDRNGVVLDGSTKITADTLFDNPQSVTISAWANLDEADSNGAEVVSLGDNIAIRLDSSGDSGAFVHTGPSTWVFATISETFATTGWHFYAASFDDNTDTLKFYVDGDEVASESATAISYSGPGTSTVVGSNGAGDQYFDFTGTIDDVRVYDHVVPAATIKELSELSTITTKYDWDCKGNLTKVTDKLGHITQYDYDSLNRLITRTDPDPDGEGLDYDSPVTRYTYNALGLMTSMTDPEQDVTFYQYDDMGRQTTEAKVSGAGLRGEYRDEMGDLAHTRLDSEVNFDDSDFFGLPDGFTASWKGAIYFDFDTDPSRDVTFFLDSTDLSELLIDGQSVVSNSGTGTDVGGDAMLLTAGWHTLTLTFDDDNTPGDNGLVLSYDIHDGNDEVVVPSTALFTTEVTATAYDDTGNVTALTDPDGNTTNYNYDEINRLTSESIVIDANTLTRSYKYDGNGNLIQKTDRNGRVTTYEYDALNRLKAEKWYTDQDALDNYPESPLDTFSFSYDDNGNLLSTSQADDTFDYEFSYDNLNRQIDVEQSITGLDLPIDIGHSYDAASRMTSSAVSLDESLDYQNGYTYDALGRVTSLTQTDQGDLAVSPKRVDFSYNAIGQISHIARYASATTANPVATSDYTYDQDNRLTVIAHLGTALDSTFSQTHGYQYDADSRLTQHTSAIDVSETNYTYDLTGQITGAGDESYAYDTNGNRTEDASSSYTTGPFNRLTSDDTYTYEYDDEGNLIVRTVTNDFGHRFYYTWDNRDRLTHISEWDGDHEILTVDYAYDAFNQLIYEHSDRPFDGDPHTAAFVHDNGQVVLQFDKADSGDLDEENLSHRYLWGPAVDQLLADEQVDFVDNSDADGPVMWALADKQGSVTDLVDSDGVERLHRVFDSFGNITSEDHYDGGGDPVISEDAGYVDEAFAFTGRFLDKATGLQNNLNRWYDSTTGRWLSEDPTGFEAGDANLYRYVGNSPTSWVDPTGLWTVGIGFGQHFHIFALHFYWGIDLHVGYSGRHGVTVGGGPTVGAGVGVGLGTNVGVAVTVTNADAVGDLSGCSGASGFDVGVIEAVGVEVIGGRNYGGVVYSGPPLPGGGIGGGAYIDIRCSKYIGKLY